jgi:hypothetical protein
MKEIIVYENMKPCIVYAKAIVSGYYDWLVFVSKVEKDDYRSPHIKNFFCMMIDEYKHQVYFHEDGEGGWGRVNSGWKFYTPTKEQKQTLIKEMAKRGYKYVSVLNRLVKKS